jgi:hypothetical protein
VTRRIRRRGEHEISRKTIACGNAGLLRWTCGDYARVFVFITHEAAGASTPGIPHALIFLGGRFMHHSGASRREIADLHLN